MVRGLILLVHPSQRSFIQNLQRTENLQNKKPQRMMDIQAIQQYSHHGLRIQLHCLLTKKFNEFDGMLPEMAESFGLSCNAEWSVN